MSLDRIADALDRIVAHLEAKPTRELTGHPGRTLCRECVKSDPRVLRITAHEPGPACETCGALAALAQLSVVEP